MSDFEPIGSLLGLQFPNLGITVEKQPPKPEWLAVLAPTVVYERRLELLREAQAKKIVLPDMPRDVVYHASWYRSRIRQTEVLLERARYRDQVQAQAPTGCGCLGTGLQPSGDYCGCAAGATRHADEQAARRARAAAVRDQRWQTAEIPSDFRALTFGSLVQRDPTKRSLVETVGRWLSETTDWLVLEGQVGRSKTGIACCLLRAGIEAGLSGLFVRVPQMLDRLRRSYDPELGRGDVGLVDRLTSVELLVLDDLGAERVTGWVLETLDKLIDARWSQAAERRTIVTTNADLERLAEQLGPRVTSRLMGSSAVIEVTGEDLRTGTAGS